MRRGAELLRQQNLQFDGLLKTALVRRKLGRAIPAAPLRSSTKRWPRATARASRVRSGTASGARRNPAEARPRQSRARGRRAPCRHRGRKQQGTRSFELRAALALAKLYQSTARPAEAHAVPAPALEGFAPTPEMPEIAEAQALLERLV